MLQNSVDTISLTTAGLVVIKNRKLLLAFSKNKKAWYLPGGKVDHGETTIHALIREIKEELNIDMEPHELRFYTHISAPAFGEKKNVLMEQDCFLYELKYLPRPAAEIESIRYFDITAYGTEQARVPGVIMIMQQLKNDNYID
ncbi:MAG TPA: NUDIX domain-containing protein [Puia sp.]|nr:NUDIX domain-containing protein [Puia sp.]